MVAAVKLTKFIIIVFCKKIIIKAFLLYFSDMPGTWKLGINENVNRFKM